MLCHAVPFVRVRDSDCVTCHDHTNDHVDVAASARVGLQHVRCATCHQEHNEPPHLIVNSDELCTNCHARPERFAAIERLPETSGFLDCRAPEVRCLSAALLASPGRYRPHVRLACARRSN